jgi:hypothetical protein
VYSVASSETILKSRHRRDAPQAKHSLLGFALLNRSARLKEVDLEKRENLFHILILRRIFCLTFALILSTYQHQKLGMENGYKQKGGPFRPSGEEDWALINLTKGMLDRDFENQKKRAEEFRRQMLLL